MDDVLVWKVSFREYLYNMQTKIWLNQLHVQLKIALSKNNKTRIKFDIWYYFFVFIWALLVLQIILDKSNF